MAKAKAAAKAKEEVVAAEFAIGDTVTFKGYADDVPEAERLLTEGESYPVVDVNAEEESLGVEIDNPDFNAKKKVSETNQEKLVVDVFFDEVDVAEVEEAAAEPAPAARTRPAAKAAPVAAKAAPAAAKAAPAAKGKAAPVAKGKAAPAAKGKAKAAPVKEVPEVKDESEALPALNEEDADIVALIDGADLLELATEMVDDAEALNYRLGGILYHLRLGKSYQEVDAKYAVKGGWQLFIEEQIPGLGYRKAMNLIDIYYEVNLNNIDPAKVQQIGWAKMAKIVQVMTADNAEELVELAETSTVAVLTDVIKESYKEVGGTKGETRKKTAYKFRLWEDQAAGVSEVIAAVQESMGFKDPSDAFEHIVMEWAAEHPIEPKKAAVVAKAKAAPVAAAKAAPVAKARTRG